MNDPAPDSPPSRLLTPPACAVGLALLTLVWLWTCLAPATMSPDSNGYIVQARLIATAGTTHLTTESPAQFVGVHWLETKDGTFQSRYPAGLPMMLALAWKIGGLGAAVLVNPLLASATVFLVFQLARRFAGGWTALLAAAVFATNATVQQHALDADAHIAAASFLTAGVLALLRFADDPTPARGLLAGVLLGIVPTVRYPEALAGVAVGAWLLWRVRPIGRVWSAVLGAALPIGALCVHNAAAYGAFWRTGYALTNEQTAFGLNYFAEHWLGYLHNLGGTGLGVFFAFGAAGLAGLVADARHRVAGVLFAGIVAPLLLLYMAYYFGNGEGSLRFLVPLYPLLVVAGAWLLGRTTAALGGAGRTVWATVALLQLLPGTVSAVQTATRLHATLRSAVVARTTLQRNAPAGSVVIVDHQLGESLDSVGQWRLVEENLIGGAGPRVGQLRPGLRRGGLLPGARGGPRLANVGPEQPSPQQPNKNLAQRARYDGVSAVERQARVWEDIRKWAGDRPVFWYARSLDQVENALPDGADYEPIAEVEAPAMIGPGGRGGAGAGGPGRGGAGGPLPGPDGIPGGRGMGPPMLNQRGVGPGMNFAPNAGPPGAVLGPGQNQKLQLVKITFAKAEAGAASASRR